MIKPSSHSGSGPFAVVHGAGGTWRILVVQADRDHPTIVEAAEFQRGEEGGIAPLLSRHAVNRTITVLPASKTVCRTCDLPSADPEQLHQALELQAEVNLSGQTGLHRRGLAVLPAAAGETSRTGLILSWPARATMTTPSLGTSEDAAPLRTFAPDIAGVAALLNGHRPASPVLWIDRATGAVAMAISHANGATLRATREHDADTSVWRKRVTQSVAETALGAGHSGAYATGVVDRIEPAIESIGTDGAALILPDEVRAASVSRIGGARDDAAWWSTFGIAAGVAIAATGELAELTTMKDTEEIDRPSRADAAVTALSRPRTAVRVAVVCIILLGITPVAVSGLRLAILKLRHGDIATERRAVERASQNIEMYRALQTSAWPMAKLLSDVVCCTPNGINIETIRLQQSSGQFSITGRAIGYRPRSGEGERSAEQLVADMQRLLGESGVFAEVNYTLGDKNNYGHFDLEMSAKVVDPYFRPREYSDELDYARWPLGARIAGLEPGAEVTYDASGAVLVSNAGGGAGPASSGSRAGGNGAGERTPPRDEGTRVADASSGGGNGVRGGSRPAVSEAPERAGTPRPPRPGGGVRPPVAGGGNAEGTSKMSDPNDRDDTVNPIDVPTLTKAQIDAMTDDQVNDNLLRVAAARRKLRNSGNEELLERLQGEFDMLMERKRAAQGGGR